MLGKKTNSLQPGLVWMPYITSQTVSTITDSFNPRLGLKSRYSVQTVNPKYYGYIRTINLIRKDKIGKIFKMKNPTN